MASAYADAPLLAIALQQDKDLNSLHINSTIEWNRDDLHERQKRADLEKKNIFYGKPEGSKIVRQYKVGDKNIKVEMAFPKKQQVDGQTKVPELNFFCLRKNVYFLCLTTSDNIQRNTPQSQKLVSSLGRNP